MRSQCPGGFYAFLLILLMGLNPVSGFGQSAANPVYVDKTGVLRWTRNNAEAAFFGVNYTVPFAYGYRSHQALNVNIEQAIDQDVYHFARLGLDAFRVHVWDTEITDSLGNLLENEHLRLFDYLVYKLKARNIKILITPIAFWGPGYPEKDQPTAGFSSRYPKAQAVVNDTAIRAQENYLAQFFKHTNPYTKVTYGNDPDVIACEVNNEPHHSGPKEKTTEYVNRMVRAIRGTGWTKPVFYNISESPRYADAVARADIDGVSFQWYPTGLVAGYTLRGNYLPHVDCYHIPFDTIPQFAGKARMVYEFDAGDVLQPNMYPAMARSFRAAGFGWATQFAYDPLATAYGNTEYQTHYLNLAYTPAKAISLMIAAKAFHQLPRLKNYGTYPADTLFGAFRVSYPASLSEMNAAEEFYHAGTTATVPANLARLRHIAGVGSSPVVQYEGYGAYFLDQLAEGVWRLEVLPDAVQLQDPFAKASPGKEVIRIQWGRQAMQIKLPDLREDFRVQGLNDGNTYAATARGGQFLIPPGTYALTRAGKKRPGGQRTAGVIGLEEFVAPQPVRSEPFVRHEPYREVSAGKPFAVAATIVGIDTTARVSLLINNLSGVYKTIPLARVTPYRYQATVPPDLTTPGLLNYRILVQKDRDAFYTFPGNHPGDPYAWDYYHNESWQTYVAAEKGALQLFDAGRDRNLFVFPNLWKSNERQLITTQKPGQLLFKLSATALTGEQVMGWQHYFADKLAGRRTELSSFDRLVIRARTANPAPVRVKVALVTHEAASFAAYVPVNGELRDIAIPLASLKPDAYTLLPRPYPGFQPFAFKAPAAGGLDLSKAEKLEITLGPGLPGAASALPVDLEVEAVWLEKR